MFQNKLKYSKIIKDMKRQYKPELVNIRSDMRVLKEKTKNSCRKTKLQRTRKQINPTVNTLNER